MANEDRQETSEGREAIDEGFPVLREDVAGIDGGSAEDWVCAPARTGRGRDVAVFAAATPGGAQLAGWLKERGGTRVAPESTGGYCGAPHELLRLHRLTVVLANN